MKILIIGSCRNNDPEHKLEEHRELAEKIGEQLAKRGHEIITGGAGGLQGILVDSYKKNKGKNWTVYLAQEEDKDNMAKPTTGVKPDKIINTKFNYAVRDAYYIGKSDAVLALSGKALTLAEIIHAVKNYHKKVFQLNIGENVKLIPLFSELKEGILITSDIIQGLDFLESSYRKTSLS